MPYRELIALKGRQMVLEISTISYSVESAVSPVQYMAVGLIYEKLFKESDGLVSKVL